jgi:hypothetical protein
MKKELVGVIDYLLMAIVLALILFGAYMCG